MADSRRLLLIPVLLGFFYLAGRIDALKQDPFMDACVNYTNLTYGKRSANFRDPDVQLCDSNLTLGWYRFSMQDGGQMANRCVPSFSCGTFAPGWLEGSHPTVYQGEVQRRVCFNLNGDCCANSVLARVRNCGLFHVYRLEAPSYCPFRYCGEGRNDSSKVQENKFDACSNYTLLLSNDRQLMSNKTESKPLCDNNLAEGWYRFSSVAGEKMQDQCPVDAHCDTRASGWLENNHPSVKDGEVPRHVCFAMDENCCNESQKIVVKNCGDFFVYKLNATSFCPSRYCGGNQTSHNISGPHFQEECTKHTTLNSPDRADEYYNPYVSKSDVTLVPGWYRFHGRAGDKIPEQPPPLFHCGTHAPGWMNGEHPTIEQGVVARQVCFRWGDDRCRFQTSVWVHNCGNFMVYYLPALTINYSRYCGDGGYTDPYYQPHPGVSIQ